MAEPLHLVLLPAADLRPVVALVAPLVAVLLPVGRAVLLAGTICGTPAIEFRTWCNCWPPARMPSSCA